ncbi:MAG: metallophosphoesterase family protein [Pyrinomonadaceae bacterium]
MEDGKPQPTDPQKHDLKQRLENDLALKFSLLKTIKFLEASEYALIQLMIDNKIWIGPVPDDPGGSGDVEWGPIPYWLHNPPQFILDYIESNDILKDAWKILEFFLPARIDSANYNALESTAAQQGIVAADGTIYGDSPYEQLDPRWLFSLADYLIVVTLGDMAQFSDKQVAPIPLKDNHGQVKIALVGDWGTGAFTDGEAISIMQQIMGLSPDYLIHLGDVYYAGTAGDFLPLNEEANNFLSDWPGVSQLPAGNSFMLNSNHEMYSGAKGYFNIALADERFSQQAGTSFFALQYAGWTILGLDSAYYSSSAMFMTGSLGTNGVQSGWIQGLTSEGQKLSPDKVIVLTHHNGLSYDGLVEVTPYWDQVSSALNGDPAAWYWGHVHDGVAYKSPTVTNRKTLARCVGHGAVPYGDAFGLASSVQVDYYAHTPAPLPLRVLNGFVLLTIDSNGVVTEEFYEQGNTSVKYSNQYS